MGKPSVDYEAGQTMYPFEAMSIDGAVASASFRPWSGVSGFAPVVAPYGLLTGGAITPNTGTDNSVSVAAATVQMAGATGADANGQRSVSSGAVAASRGTVGDPYRITSVTVNTSGALAAVPGVAGDGFSEARGADGGPPWIPDGSIEIGQIRLTSHTAADVSASEIFAVPNVHVEMANFPVFQIDAGRGEVHFATPLPLIHTGVIPKRVYVKGFEPVFSPLAYVANWQPAEISFGASSEDTYDGPIAAETSSLGQAQFTALGLVDGVTDVVAKVKGQELWFRFRPDRDKMTPYQLTQGRLGISRNFPAAGGTFNAACTITARRETLDVAS